MTSVTPDRLLAGIDAIAASLSNHPKALALLALGSCGVERARLDKFSDLDFFVIVVESAKQEFIANLEWLKTGSPIVFAHKNTCDGWKTLDQDGVFCEFAVFHPAELAHIPFNAGRIIWARDSFEMAVTQPTRNNREADIGWLTSEALCNILIGLKRYLRGERLAAWRMIGVDSSELVCRALQSGAQADDFNPWRRIESLNPKAAHTMQFARDSCDAPNFARALIGVLHSFGPLPLALMAEIEAHLELCDAG